ncbi:MAG: alkaline phosphatase family protein [Marinifilaceae bacterium]|jgi:predicted AlkP superfamily pyrophosphatase or phosphodiesterase|nr:alkaline phosphatase family protein [Marinifilaceae bacterium]
MHLLKFKLSLIILICCFNISGSFAQIRKIPSEKPKLIVAIVVDHLRSDYYNRYQHLLTDGGFRRIIKDGSNCRNTKYSYIYSQTGTDHASIFTGCDPAIHGIVSKGWYNRLNDKYVSSTEDRDAQIFGVDRINNKGCSPKKLLAPTIGDQMKLYNNTSKVIGVGLNSESAMFSAGHSANGVYWLDRFSGRFTSSKFYLDSIPEWVNKFNSKKLYDFYLKQTWMPINTMRKKNIGYNLKVKLGLNKEFSYELSKMKDRIGYNTLKTTPFGNMYVRDFAQKAIIHENLGKDDDTDLITINFTSLTGAYPKLSPFDPEILDNYLRLDIEIENFLNFLDKQVGIENTLIILSSDQIANYTNKTLEKNNVPTGVFSMYNSVALLKSYLNISYGSGKWILGYDSQQIYLNRKLIEDSKKSLKEFQEKTSEFFVQFSGVAKTISSSSLQNVNFTHGVASKIQKSYNQKRSGDIFYTLEPGWRHEYKNHGENLSVYSYTTQVPLYWYGWKVKRMEINRSVGIEDIVPTLSNILDLTISSNCNGKIIPEIIEY